MAEREGHWPKIIRAEENFAAARAEFDFYREGDVYGTRFNFEAATGECVLTTFERYPPSVRFAVLLGDTMNCLRNAFDNLAYALVSLHAPGRLSDPTNIWFPTHETTKTRKGKERTRDALLAGVAGLPEPVRTLIEGQQPYHAGENAIRHPLARISRLANIDKHREILVTSTYAPNGGRFSLWGNGVMLGVQSVWGSFKPGAEIVRFPVTWEDAQKAGCESPEDVDVQGGAPIAPAFNEPSLSFDEPIYEVVEALLEYTRLTVSLIATAGGMV